MGRFFAAFLIFVFLTFAGWLSGLALTSLFVMLFGVSDGFGVMGLSLVGSLAGLLMGFFGGLVAAYFHLKSSYAKE